MWCGKCYNIKRFQKLLHQLDLKVGNLFMTWNRGIRIFSVYILFGIGDDVMLRQLVGWLGFGNGLEVPSTYDPSLHYNCFVEAAPAQIRQALYGRLHKEGQIRASHHLPDGRLQLSVLNLHAGMKALDAVSGSEHAAYKLQKADLIELMMRRPDLELTFVSKKGEVHHVETLHLSQLVLGSEEALRRGVSSHQKRVYRRAIECYDEAIAIEPLDLRAWNNKIVALLQDGRPEEALGIADEVLHGHPDVAMLWDTKACVLASMRRQLEAGECFSRAISLSDSNDFEPRLEFDEETDPWLQEVMDFARQGGKDPETDAQFWFSGFKGYLQSAKENDAAGRNDEAGSDVGRALMCLQMAARIGPEYGVAAIGFGNQSVFMCFPDSKGSPETMRDFYLRLERENADRKPSK
jgi:tetratricopeptide (TPR) repeat protein